MNATQIHSELAALAQGELQVRAQVSRWEGQLREALSAEPRFFNQGDVEEARAQRDAAERRVQKIRERTAALRSELPSDAEHAAAKVTASELTAIVEGRAEAFRVAWHEFASLLEEAADVASRMGEARAEHRSADARLRDLTSRYALGGTVLSATQLSRAETEYTSALVTLLTQAVTGEVSEAVLTQVARLRHVRNAGASS